LLLLTTTTPSRPNPTLVDPVCQASLLRYTWPEEDGPKHGTILFSNPATAAISFGLPVV